MTESRPLGFLILQLMSRAFHVRETTHDFQSTIKTVFTGENRKRKTRI